MPTTQTATADGITTDAAASPLLPVGILPHSNKQQQNTSIAVVTTTTINDVEPQSATSDYGRLFSPSQ